MDSQTVKQMLDFIELSPSRYHVVAGMKKELREAGYSELFESDRWKLCAGGKYFVVRNDSAILAFQIPKTDFRGFMIMASHSDSPAFKIKENPEILVEAAYTKLNVEKYGGALLAQWLDRPLSVAGRIFVK
ncbi:MAG TPA: M18 family aminopeptidase, partial [Lachnospiraceae bacterium]|nr:M18 family aminopeptidase [Lachnospiraceae bacterium]